MNTVDIVLGIFLLYGLVRGFFRGFLTELASLVGLVAGIYGAIHFSYYAGEFLSQHVDWDIEIINLASLAITFLIIIFVVSLVGKMLTKAADFAALGIVNKLLGAVFGLLKSAFVASVIIMFFMTSNKTLEFVETETLEESVLYEPVAVIAPIILPSIIKQVKEKDLWDTEAEAK
ncbi:CvpA family protein [Christiangramia sp. OXR-203]|jgi:membrane protein required for colicin V production|uniref:CvpA family protein n=1 Tax=Christiangramia sp. OXR-203 TaxID=3100176 RepID=UPI002AC90F81|nr:CvpA family protein [Christiangramia sp. OXR-203]WPY98590.1 CvpA family protein [Christiangramia sp. OXR-203]